MNAVSSSFSTVLDLPPCCVEFSPTYPLYAFIGTYFLSKAEEKLEEQGKDLEIGEADQETNKDQQSQQRSGSIVVVKVKSNFLESQSECRHDAEDSTAPALNVVQTYQTEYGILDLHFSPHNHNIFCTANSTKSISLFSTSIKESNEAQSSEVSINKLAFLDPFPVGTLALALQWHPLEKQTIGISLSNGEVILLQVQNLQELDSSDLSFHPKLHTLRTISTHDLEAWTLSFIISPGNGDDQCGMLSGGDDSTLRFVSNLSKTVDDEDIVNLSWNNSRIHSAGVTSILPLTSTIVLTGSYDDNIRLLELPVSTPLRPRVLADKNLGGGVWRLKLIPQWSSKLLSLRINEKDGSQDDVEIYVLASCMYNGAHILCITKSAASEAESEGWKIEVIASLQEHKSMNYGSDFIMSEKVQQDLWVMSTSFYDKLLCLTRIPFPTSLNEDRKR